MDRSELLAKLRRFESYYEAPSWKKPFISFPRFIRNQVAKRAKPERGSLHQAEVFHFPGFTIVHGEVVSEQLRFYGYYESDLTEAILRAVTSGQTVVDIGMHLGYYTSLLALLVGPNGAVHSFEPTPSTRELAQHNVGKFRNVTVHPEAVWSSPGRMEFKDYGREWLAFNSFTKARLEEEPAKPVTFNVEATTLDRFRQTLGGPISFIKIDAESAERAIVTGAREALRADQPIVSVEVGDFGSDNSSAELIRDLRELGFIPLEMRDGKFVQHAPKKSYEYSNLLFATREKANMLQAAND